MRIGEIAPGLTEVEPGWWTAGESSVVSYPAAGHQATEQVEETSFWYRHRADCIMAAVAQHPPGGPIYDIGAGIGTIALRLASMGHETVVVEPGRDGARTAWERGARPVVHATTQAAGFLPGTLPAVGLFDVVEHVEDDRGFMRHIRELLTDRGLVYVTVPAMPFLWSSDDVRAGHFRRHTEATLDELMHASGLTIEYSTYFFRPLPLPVLIVRAMPTRLGLRKPEDTAAAAKDHRRGQGRLATIRDALLAPEVAAVRSGRHMAFGTSILAVARRT